MIFNSVEFGIFLPLVFLVYWFLLNRNLQAQNLFIVAASFLFYGWWDWRFLFLMIATALIDFFIARKIQVTTKRQHRRWLLAASLISNLTVLGFFKYYNFFVTSFCEAFTFLGYPLQPRSLSLILPVGISFYTFQALSYTIDVYRRHLPASRNVVEYFAFISFFPQLVAGPIERATNLLPQFQQHRVFDPVRATDGMRQILWGLFKKMVIADNCAVLVNEVFNSHETFSAAGLVTGAVLFAFQIYGDFSGYSDIAIGTARLFGFELMRNFAFPYFSRDIAEFWRRWHISLSTWFRDYLYIPLGGSIGTRRKAVRNTFVIFLVSGFWHGANWTFMVWGLLNAVYFLPLMITGKNRQNMHIVAEGRWLPGWRDFLAIMITFGLTVLAWVFFRAASIRDAMLYLEGVFSLREGQWLSISDKLLLALPILILAEWVQRARRHALDFTGRPISLVFRWVIYLFIVVLILFFSGGQQDFIYFQF